MTESTMDSLNPTQEDFAAMLDASMAGQQVLEGRVVSGLVAAIENEFVIVDVGLKTEGRIPMREFSEEEAKKVVVGGKVDVYVDRVENAL
ncbi:MAG: S1 RNA-binding domain-containing protein, partial [Robiginitomaculum sp.]|nr:S1 RNA-binding domain-containing protein [Robiginitomaculum sp.]